MVFLLYYYSKSFCYLYLFSYFVVEISNAIIQAGFHVPHDCMQKYFNKYQKGNVRQEIFFPI